MMNRAIKKIAMLFIGCGLAFSVSMGAYIPESHKENYQKLKAEMEEVEQGLSERRRITCSWGEDGKVVIGDIGHNDMYAESWCHLKNVLAFVDEYRKFDAKELEKKLKKFNRNARVSGYEVFDEVEQMPRFKNDSGIYGWKSIGTLLEKALEDWKEVKLRITIQSHW